MENKHGKGLLKPEYRTTTGWSNTNQAFACYRHGGYLYLVV